MKVIIRAYDCTNIARTSNETEPSVTNPPVHHRVNREQLERFQVLSPESQEQNLALAVLYVPSSRDSGQASALLLGCSGGPQMGGDLTSPLWSWPVCTTQEVISHIFTHAPSKSSKILHNNCFDFKKICDETYYSYRSASEILKQPCWNLHCVHFFHLNQHPYENL